MTRDAARRPNAPSVHTPEEIGTDGPGRDHDHALDHGIDGPDPDEASDHHMLAKNWSITDGDYATHSGEIFH